MSFDLHPNLAKKTFIVDLALCRVLLEDNRDCPWILLVPRRDNISRIMQLEVADQLQLLKELDFAQKVLWDHFEVTQLNVAAIGNKTPQLHLHVIGRRSDDPAWPNTVWDHPSKKTYTPAQKEKMLYRLKKLFH